MTLALAAVLSTALAAGPAWRDAALSDAPEVRGPVLAKLHAKGKPGLYALQDVVAQSEQPDERAKAIRALGELGDPAAEWALRLEFKQTAPQVLAAVVGAADRLQLKGLERPIAELVGNVDPAIVAALGHAAARFPTVAERAFGLVAEADPVRQLIGLRILGLAGLAVPEADAQRLAQSSSVELRFAAASALAATNPEAAAGILGELVDSADPALAAQARGALGKLSTPRAQEILGALAQRLDTPPGIYEAVAQTSAGLRLLIKLEVDSSELKARDVAPVLDAAATPPLLLPLLADPEAAVAQRAAQRLARTPAGLAALTHCLLALEPQAACCAVGLAASPDLSVLEPALRSLTTEVRLDAVAGLATLPGGPPLALLQPLVSDPAPEVRAALARPLGRLGEVALAALETLVHDPEASVRAAAVVPLTALLPSAGLERLASESVNDEPVRRQLLPSVTRVSSALAVRVLVASLHSTDADERHAAVAALGHYRDRTAVDALLDAAASDADPRVREYALSLLSNN